MDSQKRTANPFVAPPREPLWEVSFQITKGLDSATVFFTVRAWSSEVATLRASRYMSDGLHKYVDAVFTKKRDLRIVNVK